jgi:hypothetical protein
MCVFAVFNWFSCVLQVFSPCRLFLLTAKVPTRVSHVTCYSKDDRMRQPRRFTYLNSYSNTVCKLLQIPVHFCNLLRSCYSNDRSYLLPFTILVLSLSRLLLGWYIKLSHCCLHIICKQDLSFSQQCCWRFQSSGMLCCIVLLLSDTAYHPRRCGSKFFPVSNYTGGTKINLLD